MQHKKARTTLEVVVSSQFAELLDQAEESVLRPFLGVWTCLFASCPGAVVKCMDGDDGVSCFYHY
jgi:hypothetical protein